MTATTKRRALAGADVAGAGPGWVRAESAKVAWGAFALAAALAAVFLFHITRTTTLWFDEWLWAVGRRGGDIGTYLHPYNEHLSLVPVAIYHLLFATAGLHDYVPFRAVAIAGHLACALLVFVYAKRRVGDYLGLLAAVLILFLGPGWQDIIWPFQIAWTVAIAAGVGAFLLLDRRDRAGDIAACVLLVISIASTSVGVAITLGAAVEVAFGRRRWREAWIAAVPLGLYVIWSIGYQHATIIGRLVYGVESYVARSAAASVSALLGLSGLSVANQNGTVLAFGVPLLVLAVAAVLVRTRRIGWAPRAAALMIVLLAFWVLTALGRAIGPPFASRYLYFDGVFVLLVAVELARGTRCTWRVGVPLTVLTAAAALSNIGAMRDGAGFLRSQAAVTRADLGTIDLARASVPAGYPLTRLPGYPFVVIRAGQYFAAERALGTPADTPTEIATAPAPARTAADGELLRVYGVRLAPAAGAASRGSCATAAAPAAAPIGAAAQLPLTLPAGGVHVSAAGAPATVGLRRFGDAYHPLGIVQPGGSADVRISTDAVPAAWHLDVSTSGRAVVCDLP